MKRNKYRPIIRSNQDHDDWQISPFSDIFKILGNNTLSRAELSDNIGAVMNIHYGDVLIKFGTCIDVQNDEIPYIINQERAKVGRNTILHDGDVIFADTAEDETVGKCSVILNTKDKMVVSGLHTIPCRPKTNFGEAYLGYYLNSSAYHSQLFPLMQGIKVVSISKSAIQTTNICYPAYNEQKQIGSFFRNIDELISNCGKEIDKLKTFKNACLLNMFPKKGSKRPDVRFKGFNDEWEDNRLGDYVKFRRGLTYSPSDITNKDTGGILVMRSSNINIDMFVYHSDDVYVKPEAVDIPFANRNDILVTSANGSSNLVGKHAIIRDLNQLAVHGGFMLLGSCKYPEFVNALMATSWYSLLIKVCVYGGNGAIGNLNKNELSDARVLLPSSEEQKAIGLYFSNLDLLLNQQINKLEKLNHLKASLLNKMFVNMEG